MASFCGVCGQDIKPGETVCSVCLTPVNNSAPANTEAQPVVEQVAPQQQYGSYQSASQQYSNYQTVPQQQYGSYQPAAQQYGTQQQYDSYQQQYGGYQPAHVNTQNVQAQYNNYQASPANDENMAPVVSAGKFFGLTLLFSIPVVGFIMLIVMSFAPQNKNIKNYARSYWIFVAIILVLAIIVAILAVLGVVSVGSMLGGYY